MLYNLARVRNARDAEPVIPQEIIERTPTDAGGRLARPAAYDVLDPIVQRYLEGGQSLDELVAAGFDPAVVRGVLQLVDDAEFKRRQTPPGRQGDDARVRPGPEHADRQLVAAVPRATRPS